MFPKILTIVGLLFSFSVRSIPQDTIEWSKNRKLEWKDYEAFLEKNTPVGAASSVGIIYKVVTQSYEKCLVKIFAGFVKKRSCAWKEKATDNLLTHEQGHFDLAEVYTRKMRKALLNYEYLFDYTKSNEVIDKILNTYADSLSIAHKEYDMDTQYSQEPTKQKEWSFRIKRELKDLEKFNTPFVNLYFKK